MRHLKNLIVAVAAMAIFGLAPTANAQAVDTGTATVSIMKAITLSETTPMSWGSIARPANGTADYTLNYSTGAVSLTATTSTNFPGFAVDNGTNGVWAVAGEASTGITFSVAIGAFDGTGLTVLAAHINGTSDNGTDTLDASGDFTLNLGGILRVTSAASLGLQTATVTVTVDYS
jgi:hypothetical protein